jgi:inosine/xanthosine triphosphatase
MKVLIATKNSAKIKAVKEVLKEYDLFQEVKIESKKADSGVAEQPKSLEETIKGAKNRAKKSFRNCNFSIGIESGLIKIENNFFDITVAVVFNGKKFSLGFSSSWQCPIEITQLIREEGLNMTQAACKCGLSIKNDLGDKEGLIGILTKKRITRKDYTKQALYMAFIPIENESLYA